MQSGCPHEDLFLMIFGRLTCFLFNIQEHSKRWTACGDVELRRAASPQHFPESSPLHRNWRDPKECRKNFAVDFPLDILHDIRKISRKRNYAMYKGHESWPFNAEKATGEEVPVDTGGSSCGKHRPHGNFGAI
jgi:hypothetical protein